MKQSEKKRFVFNWCLWLGTTAMGKWIAGMKPDGQDVEYYIKPLNIREGKHTGSRQYHTNRSFKENDSDSLLNRHKGDRKRSHRTPYSIALLVPFPDGVLRRIKWTIVLYWSHMATFNECYYIIGHCNAMHHPHHYLLEETDITVL